MRENSPQNLKKLNFVVILNLPLKPGFSEPDLMPEILIGLPHSVAHIMRSRKCEIPSNSNSPRLIALHLRSLRGIRFPMP